MKRHWLALALSVVGCLKPDDDIIFDRDVSAGVSGSAPSVAGNAGAQAGTDSGQYMAGATSGGTAGSSVGGSAPSGGVGGAQSLGGSGGSGDGPPTPAVESCDMVAGSVRSELNGHCYRVNESELSFAEARAACAADAGHLLTISSAEENDFARDLRDGEHWLGAWDGRADTEAGVGPYTWVSGEPWEFTDWEENQPNAFENDCPGDDDTHCFEHCAFQSEEGDWNDRSCWHTIASICEWDLDALYGEGGAGGGAEPSPNRPSGPR